MATLDPHHLPNRSRSESWYDRACASIAGGLGHDVRHAAPFPLYIERAEGAYKWDADSNRYIDYLAGVRELTGRHGVAMIVDEVITGFRWAPGGARERAGIVADLSAHAEGDIDETVAAFDEVVDELLDEGRLAVLA